MPYCQNCGRPLAENEVCSCTPRNTNPNSGMPSPAVYQYSDTPDQNIIKKKKNVVIVIVIVLIVISSFLGYVIHIKLRFDNKAKQSAIHSIANSIYAAYESVIFEMEQEGHDFGDSTFIICSDPSLNVNVPFDSNVIYEKAEEYYCYIDKYRYFVVVENGNVSYASCIVIDGKPSKYIGTFPYFSGLDEAPMTYTNSVGEKDWKFEDLYLYTRNELFGN